MVLVHVYMLVILLDIHIPFSHMLPASGLRYLYKIKFCSVLFCYLEGPRDQIRNPHFQAPSPAVSSLIRKREIEEFLTYQAPRL